MNPHSQPFQLCESHIFYSHSQVTLYQINMCFISIHLFIFPNPLSKHTIKVWFVFFWSNNFFLTPIVNLGNMRIRIKTWIIINFFYIILKTIIIGFLIPGQDLMCDACEYWIRCFNFCSLKKKKNSIVHILFRVEMFLICTLTEQYFCFGLIWFFNFQLQIILFFMGFFFWPFSYKSIFFLLKIKKLRFGLIFSGQWLFCLSLLLWTWQPLG